MVPRRPVGGQSAEGSPTAESEDRSSRASEQDVGAAQGGKSSVSPGLGSVKRKPVATGAAGARGLKSHSRQSSMEKVTGSIKRKAVGSGMSTQSGKAAPAMAGATVTQTMPGELRNTTNRSPQPPVHFQAPSQSQNQAGIPSQVSQPPPAPPHAQISMPSPNRFLRPYPLNTNFPSPSQPSRTSPTSPGRTTTQESPSGYFPQHIPSPSPSPSYSDRDRLSPSHSPIRPRSFEGERPALPPRQSTQYASAANRKNEPFHITVIRRDPGSGAQWNVATISSNGSSTTASAEVNGTVIDIEILTPGYRKFAGKGGAMSAATPAIGLDELMKIKEAAAAMQRTSISNDSARTDFLTAPTSTASPTTGRSRAGSHNSATSPSQPTTFTRQIRIINSNQAHTRSRSGETPTSPTSTNSSARLPSRPGQRKRESSITSLGSAITTSPVRTRQKIGEIAGRVAPGLVPTASFTGADDTAVTSPTGAESSNFDTPLAIPFSFLSPWGGQCVFTTGLNGRSFKCRHTIPAPQQPAQFQQNPISPNSSNPPRLDTQQQQGVTAPIAELRFNLPIFKKSADPQGRRRKDIRESWNGVSANAKAAVTAAQAQGRAGLGHFRNHSHTPGGSGAGNTGGGLVRGRIRGKSLSSGTGPNVNNSGSGIEAADNERDSRASALLHRAGQHLRSHNHFSSRRRSFSDSDSSSESSRSRSRSRSRSPPPAYLAQAPAQSSNTARTTNSMAKPASTSKDPSSEPLDLTLGRLKAGGGATGHSAKLGKLVLWDEGLKMVDLVVAGSMGVWWGVVGG